MEEGELLRGIEELDAALPYKKGPNRGIIASTDTTTLIGQKLNKGEEYAKPETLKEGWGFPYTNSPHKILEGHEKHHYEKNQLRCIIKFNQLSEATQDLLSILGEGVTNYSQRQLKYQEWGDKEAEKKYFKETREKIKETSIKTWKEALVYGLQLGHRNTDPTPVEFIGSASTSGVLAINRDDPTLEEAISKSQKRYIASQNFSKEELLTRDDLPDDELTRDLFDVWYWKSVMHPTSAGSYRFHELDQTKQLFEAQWEEASSEKKGVLANYMLRTVWERISSVDTGQYLIETFLKEEDEVIQHLDKEVVEYAGLEILGSESRALSFGSNFYGPNDSEERIPFAEEALDKVQSLYKRVGVTPDALTTRVIESARERISVLEERIKNRANPSPRSAQARDDWLRGCISFFCL